MRPGANSKLHKFLDELPLIFHRNRNPGLSVCLRLGSAAWHLKRKIGKRHRDA